MKKSGLEAAHKQEEQRKARAEASRRLRQRRAEAGRKEIRNLYVKPEHEQQVRAYAATLEVANDE